MSKKELLEVHGWKAPRLARAVKVLKKLPKDASPQSVGGALRAEGLMRSGSAPSAPEAELLLKEAHKSKPTK